MIHGALLIDKSAGPTSQDIVRKIRNILKIRKVGHTGTLDPFATGLLVVLLGDATRLARYFTDDDKQYEGYCSWGYSTDTGDLTGALVEESSNKLPDEKTISESMAKLTGRIMQVPPMYSAKKIDGRPLYKSARAGLVVDRKPVQVRINSFELSGRDENGFSFRVECSKGTYIRTLAEDLCIALKGWGHLKTLRRTKNGAFSDKDAIKLDDAQMLPKPDILTEKIIPIQKLCTRFPIVKVSSEQEKSLVHGLAPVIDKTVDHDQFDKGQTVRLINSDDRLLALAVAKVSSEEAERASKEQKVFKIENNFLAREYSKKTQ